MIHNMKIIEISIQMKKKNMSTISLVNPQHLTNKKKLNLDNVLMVFDGTSSYHSAMWDENSGFPEI